MPGSGATGAEGRARLDGLRLGVLHLAQLLQRGQRGRRAARRARVEGADARAAARLVHQVDGLPPAAALAPSSSFSYERDAARERRQHERSASPGAASCTQARSPTQAGRPPTRPTPRSRRQAARLIP
jgi:hypothetical protein